jgi:hypothetical protein
MYQKSQTLIWRRTKWEQNGVYNSKHILMQILFYSKSRISSFLIRNVERNLL